MSAELHGVIDVRQVLDLIAKDRYMSKSEAARYLSLSIRTLESHMQEMPHYKVNRKVLFKRSELDLWMQRHRVESTSKDLDQIADDAVRAVMG